MITLARVEHGITEPECCWSSAGHDGACSDRVCKVSRSTTTAVGTVLRPLDVAAHGQQINAGSRSGGTAQRPQPDPRILVALDATPKSP
jgi:hypothetical protein